MTENMIKTVKIRSIHNECEGVKTLTFNMKNNRIKHYITPKPGQFVMIWVPGVDEIPMSLSSYDDKGNWSITVKEIGECTYAINKLKIGDYIGVRGPLGNHFKIPTDESRDLCLIGGGIGMAPLKCLSRELLRLKRHFIVIEAAKINTELVFIDELDIYNKDYSELYFCTDDGSYGLKGNASAIFEDLIKNYSKEQFSKLIVYSCGPEIMLYKLFKICEKYNIEYYASLERIMRCGCGLCGLCALDPLGVLVCKDGPIFSSETLRKINDFGKYKRDFTGKKIKIE
ncbi:MAG: dihydroorotate dehydrogenase electron transfer subunit [Promethearchaeota archaeon]